MAIPSKTKACGLSLLVSTLRRSDSVGRRGSDLTGRRGPRVNWRRGKLICLGLALFSALVRGAISFGGSMSCLCILPLTLVSHVVDVIGFYKKVW